jgi:membrane fusion protein (multidrug efflux system)
MFRRYGPVKGAMALLAGLCVVLLIWNLFVAPALMSVMLSHMPRPVMPVTVAEAKPITWVPGITAVGTVKAFQGADVASELDGVVTAIDAVPGAHVAAGDRLVQIDDSVEQADFIAMQANIKLQETALARAAILTKKGVNAQATLDDARNQLDVAKSGLARNQALLDQKRVRARFDGVAGIPRVTVGQYVTKGTVLITLQDIDRVYVDFTVPEQSAKDLALGQIVHFGVSADALTYKGQIIGLDPKVDPDTRLIAVRAEIGDAKGRILPGQFLQLRIDLPAQPNVLALPATAVVPSLYGDYVYVALPPGEGKDADKSLRVVRQTIVTVGRRNGTLVEIKGGLTPGQIVIATGQNAVQNGATVKVVEQLDPAKLAARGLLQ